MSDVDRMDTNNHQEQLQHTAAKNLAENELAVKPPRPLLTPLEIPKPMSTQTAAVDDAGPPEK